jgi:glutathionyl-hydroquinone reductase
LASFRIRIALNSRARDGGGPDRASERIEADSIGPMSSLSSSEAAAADAERAEPSDRRFELGAELRNDGRWVRQDSVFRRRVTADGSSGFAAEAGRYHLYASLACPWSHRTVIGRALKGLEGAISVSYVDPFRDARGWAFSGGEFVDTVNGFAFLSEAYAATDAGFEGHVTVPVLWDRETHQIVSNESADILRMLNDAFDDLGDGDVDLCPRELREEIDAVNAFVYENVNNAVYEAGFSTNQDVYRERCLRVFGAFDQLEARLASSRCLVGERPTEADWRLFPTLVRFDSVYYLHFKCNLRRLVDYPNLWAYARDLYQQPRIAETVSIDQIKRHYYTTHDMINPSRLIPAGPELDFLAPHGRG